ncbi:hypothetical protein ACFLTT_02215 [Chloroflexota bacterium]
MGIERFIERLGKSEDKVVTTLTVPEDKIEMVEGKKSANEPDSDHTPSDSNQKITRLKSNLSELEEEQQQNGENLTERLGSVDTILTELKGIVKASPLIVQSQMLMARLEELEDGMAEMKKAWEAERESLACPNPECGELVGWPTLEVKQSIKPSYFPLFDLPPFIKPDMESYKECPVCGYKEEVDEQ